jgi:hypothetical protein
VEVFANELSINGSTFDDYKNIKNLSEVYRVLVANGIHSCRISSEDLNAIIDKLNQEPKKRDLLNFIYSFFHAPYESSENVEESVDEYLTHKWMYDTQECFGLAFSYLAESLSVSFDTETWKEIVEIKKDCETVSVKNASERSHIEYHQNWLDSLKNIELIETSIAWNEKKISLRDDHGKDKLLDFSKKICRCPYVISIINSLPFNRTEKQFIRRLRPNGIIECVLCWTDVGYGIVIQTTGRNLRETEKIAELLKTEYSV